MLAAVAPRSTAQMDLMPTALVDVLSGQGSVQRTESNCDRSGKRRRNRQCKFEFTYGCAPTFFFCIDSVLCVPQTECGLDGFFVCL